MPSEETMKAWVRVALSTVILFSASAVASAQEKYVPGPNEEIFGTWLKGAGDFGKIVSMPGKYEEYTLASDAEPYQEVTTKIESKWKDSDGNI